MVMFHDDGRCMCILLEEKERQVVLLCAQATT
jgi:hypothetical protein